MEANTSLASGIAVTKESADYDAVCKRLLSEKSILARIMKSCLEEYRDIDVDEIAEKYIEGTPIVSEIPVSPDATGPRIRGMAQEQSSPTEGSAYFDILYDAIVPNTAEIIQMIINVEAQANFHPGYPIPKRGIYYCGRMISSQDGTVFVNSHYEKLQKVCSIWVCTNPPKYLRNTITRYHIAEENLVGSAHMKKEHYDMLSLVMICLGKPDEEGSSGILKLLSVLLSPTTASEEKKQILQDEFHIPMTQEMDREVSFMCNLSQGVWASGIEEGIKQSTVSHIQSFMRNMNLPIEKVLSAMDVPRDEWEQYTAKIVTQ